MIIYTLIYNNNLLYTCSTAQEKHRMNVMNVIIWLIEKKIVVIIHAYAIMDILKTYYNKHVKNVIIVAM